MVFLNKIKDKVISFQIRNLLSGEKRFFKIFDYSKIHYEMKPSIELDDTDRIIHDKISHFYNIFHVDFSEPVNLFEEYIDSTFLPNGKRRWYNIEICFG